jgi:hypothetical protein
MCPDLAAVLKLSSEQQKRFVTKREKRPSESSEDAEFVLRPFYGRQRVPQCDDFLAIVEGSTTHQNVWQATSLQRPDIFAGDVLSKITELTKKERHMARADGRENPVFSYRPATLMD